MYYAACAKLKELFSGVDILLTNGFKNPQQNYFTYQMVPLASLGPINITDFRKSLVIHENFLYSQELIELLDNGIKRKTMHENKYDIRKASSTQEGIVPDYSIFAKFGFPMPAQSPRDASADEYDSQEEPITLDDAPEGDINNVQY